MVGLQNMRNLIYITICFIFFACDSDSHDRNFYTVPTLKVPEGMTKGFDLSVYKSHSDMTIHFEFHPDLIIRFDSDSDSLFITPKASTSQLLFLTGTAGQFPINLPITIEPMIEYKFKLKSQWENNQVFVMGNFNDWSRTKHPLNDKNGNGLFERSVFLKPNTYEYKFVVGDSEIIDPENENVISNNMGGWNSVLDLSHFKESPSGQWVKKNHEGNYLTFTFLKSSDVLPMETIALWNNTRLHPDVVDPQINGDVIINISDLNYGLLRLLGLDNKGNLIKENHTWIKDGIPLHIKTSPDDWHFKTIYSLMIDRFLDGDPSNTIQIGGDLHPLVDFYGGDFEGIIQKLEDGYFSELGISALWISPFQSQPTNAFREWNPPHRMYSGYHGYWPVSPRKIDARFGTENELKTLITLAHSKHIKILSDFVSNHVHEDHPYYKTKKNWFGNVELPDGSMNIRRWDGDTRLTTWFEPFLPSFDYSNTNAIDVVVEDAVWWMQEFDLDGFRQDAVKHVPHLFWKKLTNELKQNFPEKNYYQIGETFGSDELILSYVNPSELDAQFNFDIYFTARNVFASSNGDMTLLKETLDQNFRNYQPVNLMGTITSSHDQIRFISVADKQMSFSENGTERAFNSPPEAIEHSSSYLKLANFTAFNFSIPGIPVIYYGEEIGLPGAGDPDNRRPMRFGRNLKIGESILKEKVSSLTNLRQTYTSLSIGDFYTVFLDGPTWIYFKIYFDEIILVAINHNDKRQSVSFENPIQVSSWRRLKNNIPFSLTGNKTTLHLQPYSHGYFLGE